MMKHNIDDKFPYIPLQMFLYFPSQKEAYYNGEGKQLKRFIFEGHAMRETMTTFELEEEKKFQQFLESRKKTKSLDFLDHPFWSRSGRFRWFNSNHFDCKRAIKSMQKHSQYLQLNRFDIPDEVQNNLKKGIFYVSGRDSYYRPIMVFNIPRIIDSGLTAAQIIESLRFFVQFVLSHYLLPGQVENVVGIVECGERNIFSMLGTLRECINFLSSTYRCRLRYAFIVGVPPTLKFLWNIAKTFIPEQSLRKVTLMQRRHIAPLLQFSHPSQLENHYGGTQDPITHFWPPKTAEHTSREYHSPSHQADLISPEQYQWRWKAKKMEDHRISQYLLSSETIESKEEMSEDIKPLTSSKQTLPFEDFLEKPPLLPFEVQFVSFTWKQIISYK